MHNDNNDNNDDNDNSYKLLVMIATIIAINPCPFRDVRTGHGQSPNWDSGFRRVRLERNLDFEGWNSLAHRELPGEFESTNLSRDDPSGEIGRT